MFFKKYKYSVPKTTDRFVWGIDAKWTISNFQMSHNCLAWATIIGYNAAHAKIKAAPIFACKGTLSFKKSY